MYETPAGPAADLPPGVVHGAGRFAVGNDDGDRFALTRRCRHLFADLAGGTIEDGCLTCPWHRSQYDITSGKMVRGPQGAFAAVPGLDAAVKAVANVMPLGRGMVVERDGELFVRRPG